MEHAWCSDISRDAAVRAAEDGRDRPLPTLDEAIGDAFKNTGAAHVRRLDNNSAKGMAAPVPNTQEATVSGLRTERVTLEITQLNDSCYVDLQANDWSEDILWLTAGESVRVVEEACPDAWAQTFARLEAERDAAIRERDEARKSWLRSEESGTRLLAQRNAALDDSDALRKRVSELEAASGGGEEAVAWRDHVEQMLRDWWSPTINELGDRATLEQFIGEEGLDSLIDFVLDEGKGPPQPRGWLTGEESALVKSWERHYMQGAHYAQSPSHTNDIAAEMGKLAEVCRSILARSTPPEVVLPDWVKMCVSHGRQNQLLASLAAAGVAVKEVGRE